jgi:hypothetical protein
MVMLSSASIVMVPLDIEEDLEKADPETNLAQHWEARISLSLDLFSSLRKGGFRRGLNGDVAWSKPRPRV